MIAFFDTKAYDKIWFEQLKGGHDIKYFENKLNADTAILAQGCRCVIAFVNDEIDKKTIDALVKCGVELIAMRSAGYNNIDVQYARGKLRVVHVPAYSPYAVAEYAMGLILTLGRRIHKAYNRTKDHNFNIDGLTGFDLFGKSIGIIGTGRIGRVFIDICKGFNMRILAYDPFPKDNINYVDFDTLCRESDIISLHCPLTTDTHHIINQQAISQMKDGAMLINTSRGALVDSTALLSAIKSRKFSGVALDVYEEESEFFFEDFSAKIMSNDVLAMLISMPNVIVTSHQAFLTREALYNIAETTMRSIDNFVAGRELENEIYQY